MSAAALELAAPPEARRKTLLPKAADKPWATFFVAWYVLFCLIAGICLAGAKGLPVNREFLHKLDLARNCRVAAARPGV